MTGGGAVSVSAARLRTLFAFFATLSLVLSLRVGYGQTLGRAELLGGATDQVRSELVLAAQRGVIRDRSGRVLATTVALRSLYALPRRIPDHENAARRLAPILGQSRQSIPAPLDSAPEWL